MLFLLKSFLREIILNARTEYSHVSFVSDKTSETVKSVVQSLPAKIVIAIFVQTFFIGK